MPHSSYSVEGGKGGSSSGWALHELAENHQFASGVIVSFLALAMAFGIIGLIAALPHTNISVVPPTRDTSKLADTLDSPQAFVLAASQDVDDAMTGGSQQWVGQVARPPLAVAGALQPGAEDGQ